MTETRQQVVSLINAAHCTADADAKVECLEQTKELLIRKEPALLEEFLPEILNFQAALPARPAAALVHRAAACLSALLADSVVAVAKAALQATLGFLKLAVVLCASLGGQPQPPHAAREAWEAAMQVPKHAGALVTRSGNAGTKLLAVQVVKEAALLLSAPQLPLCAAAPSLQPPTSLQGNSVVTAADLGTEADALVGCLAELLEPSTVQELMSKAVVVTNLIKAVGDIADKRPIYVGQFLPRLAALQASLHIRFVGSSKDGKGGQVLGSAASVANSLKAALLTLLSSTQSEMQVWESSLTKVLSNMGLVDAANNTIRLRNRVLRRHERDAAEASLPHGTDGQPPAPTRARLSSSDEPAASNHTSQDPPPVSTPAPTLAPIPAPVPAPAPVPQQLPPAPGRAEALLSVLGILGSLAGTNSHAALEAFVDSLTPSTLADVVLNNLAHCPATLPPHLTAPASPPPAPAPVPPVAPETAAIAPAPAPLRSPPPRSPPAMDVMGPPLEPAGSMLKKSAAVVVGPLRAQPLSDEQATDLRNSAMERLLSTSRSNARSTHGLLLAKLCSSSCPEAVVQEILDRWETRDGPALAGQLLACMYVRCGMGAASHQLQRQAAVGERMEVDGDDEAGAGIKAEAGTVAGRGANGLGGPGAGSGSSGYEEVLRRLLDGLAQKVPLKIEQSLELMLDAPHLPPQLLQSFLHGLCEGAHATDGLALAFHLCRQRAPCRWAALQVILDQAVGVLPVVQHKASVLLVTKVHPLGAMTQAVEAYATAALDALCLHQLPPATAAGATAPAGSGGREGGWRAAGTGLKLPKALTREEVQQMSEERVQQYCKLYLALMTRKPALLPRLFQVFSATLPSVQSAMVALIRQQSIGQMMPVRSQELLQALAAADEASLPLLQAVLETQTAPANGRWPHKQVPSAEYVAACRALHNRVQALWPLLPAVAAMQPTEVRRSVVPMLTQLYPLTAPGAAPPEAAQRLATEQQAAAVRIFTMQLPNGKRVMTPEDVLLRLHELDLRPPPDGYGMARVRRAIQHCLTDTQVFNKEVMAAVVNRMVQKTPFPTLMMRTLIDTYRAHPQLHSALLSHTADMLMRRGVWTDPQQFRGFLLLVKEAVPKSFELLFRLPRNKQVVALRSEPLLPLRGHIRDYAQLHGLASRLAPEVQQLLQETPPPARPPAAAIPSTVKAE